MHYPSAKVAPLFFLLFCGCSSDPESTDAGTHKDASTDVGEDAGTPDSGVVDANQPDAAEDPDSSTPDLGSPDSGSPDLGSPDLGSPDSGPDAGPSTHATLSLYGTFHSMGVTVALSNNPDPQENAGALLSYKESSATTYRAGLLLSRVTPDKFVGSLFWLTPGTSYDVRVTLRDPDGAPLEGTVLNESASTRPEIAIPSPGTTYHVSPNGNGTCAQADPCSLTEGINQAQPGDEVLLGDGTYYEGDLTLPRSGRSGAPIVIRGSTNTILDGADPSPHAWTAGSNGVFHTTIASADTHYVTADGQRLFPYEDLNNLGALSRDNQPGMMSAGTTVHVHLGSHDDPTNHTMVISRFGTAFTVERDFINFIDLTFRHYGQGSYPKVIYFDGASDNLVTGCTFADNDLGVGIKRASHRNVIQDNEFYDNIFDWPWADIKELGGLEDGGVAFYDPVSGRGNIIRRNTFHDDFDAFGACPGSTSGATNETDVYENLVYRMGDDGIETDGECSNVRIFSNTFHDVLIGISLAPVYTGPVYVLRNVVYNTGVGNNSYPGSPFKFNSGYGLSGPMFLFHNTCDAALPGNNGLYVKTPGTWTLIYARNNIWAGTNHAIENYNTSQPIDLDYDNLWNGASSGTSLVRWNNTHHTTLQDFRNATMQELHGRNIEPGFNDAPNGDYTLDSKSNLIDQGVLIPGINDNYNGAAPDIGAFEE